MGFGLSIGVLLLIRLIVRLRTTKPRIPNKGPLKGLAIGNHWALYLVLLAMVMTGLGTAQLAGLFPILEGKMVPLPTSYDADPAICRA
jgi:cytochrome b561